MWRWTLIGVAVIGAAVLGRVSAPTDDRAAVTANGSDSAGRPATSAAGAAAYAAGVRDGRALQVPPADRKAFDAGYVAGANDVFSGYDGGWDLRRRYVITLEKGDRGIAYRISSRARQP
jgi:hypothetical protein